MSKDTDGPALKINGRCIHVHVSPVKFSGGKWEYATDRRDVVLMAISGRYAMVRRPGKSPYVCLVKELEPS